MEQMVEKRNPRVQGEHRPPRLPPPCLRSRTSPHPCLSASWVIPATKPSLHISFIGTASCKGGGPQKRLPGPQRGDEKDPFVSVLPQASRPSHLVLRASPGTSRPPPHRSKQWADTLQASWQSHLAGPQPPQRLTHPLCPPWVLPHRWHQRTAKRWQDSGEKTKPNTAGGRKNNFRVGRQRRGCPLPSAGGAAHRRPSMGRGQGLNSWPSARGSPGGWSSPWVLG